MESKKKILGDLEIGTVVSCFDDRSSKNVEYVVLLQFGHYTKVLDKATNKVEDIERTTEYKNKRSVKE